MTDLYTRVQRRQGRGWGIHSIWYHWWYRCSADHNYVTIKSYPLNLWYFRISSDYIIISYTITICEMPRTSILLRMYSTLLLIIVFHYDYDFDSLWTYNNLTFRWVYDSDPILPLHARHKLVYASINDSAGSRPALINRPYIARITRYRRLGDYQLIIIGCWLSISPSLSDGSSSELLLLSSTW